MTIPYAARVSSTVEEACIATGLGKTKLYELIASGEIETATVGTRRLVLVRSIIRLIDPACLPTHDPAHKSAPIAGELERTLTDRTPRERLVPAYKYGRRRTRANTP